MDEHESCITDDQLDPNFKYEIVNEPGGDSFLKCFQCGTCTASCPVREVYPEFNPRRIIRLIKLGSKELVLTSSFVWMCSACYSCYERCPQEVDITSFMTTLKNIAARQGYGPSGLKGLLDLLDDFGGLGEITDFENTIRSKANIEEIIQSPDNVKKILISSRIRKIVKGELQ
jgi:heterodisulfide reductase subunit C